MSKLPEQLTLFDLEGSAPRRSRKAAMATSSTPRRFAKYRPLTRTLCDDCVQAIHERGVTGAPLPKTVRWRRIIDGPRWQQLCDEHKLARE
jgi:hypothetical protein